MPQNDTWKPNRHHSNILPLFRNHLTRSAVATTRARSRGTSTSIQRKLVTNEGKRHSSQTVEVRTELDLVQDEVDEAKRLLEEAHVGVQAAQNKVTEAAFWVGQVIEKMSQIKKLLEANWDPAGH